MDKNDKKRAVKEAMNLFTSNRYGKRMKFLFKVGMTLIIGLVLVPLTAVVMGVTGADSQLALAVGGIVAVVAGGSFWVLIVGALCSTPFHISKISIIRLLNRNLLEQAKNEFLSEEMKQVPGMKNKYSNNFLFYPSGRVVYLKDILWLYVHNSRTTVYGITVTEGSNMIAALIGGEQLSLLMGIKSKDFNADNLNDLFVQIQKVNPSVMIGFTEENKKAYGQLVKAAKGNMV